MFLAFARAAIGLLLLMLPTFAGMAVAQATGRAAAVDEVTTAADVVSSKEAQGIAALERDHIGAVVADLDASGRAADAALALLLWPSFQETLGLPPNPLRAPADARWQRLLAGLDQVPVDLLGALSATAKERLDAAAWAAFEAELLRRDVRNLASWLYRMGDLRNDPAELDRWLRRALQQVDRFEVMRYSVVARMVDAHARRPIHPELAAQLQVFLDDETGEPWPRPATERELWLGAAMGRYMAIAIPSLSNLAEACPIAAGKISRERRDLCQRLARHALQGAGSVLDQAMLVRIEESMAVTSADRAQAAEARRRTRWLSGHQLLSMNADEMIRFSAYLHMPGANELGWIRQRLSEANISLDPPPDWQPDSR